MNADYYVTNLILKLVEDATALMPDGCILQQDGALAHRHCDARLVTRQLQWLHSDIRMAIKLAG